MSRAEIRKMRKEWKEDLPAFIAAQKHYFPYIIQRLQKVADPRQQGSIDYSSEEILFNCIRRPNCN